ncbi:hypothetical protein FQN49_003322 [Arthroderma sp. PD_2]|nr:hypothetical protein FQN49_003322 [Arthroderma sp. PD_2]
MDAEKDIADAEIGTSCTSLSDLEDAPLTHEPEFTSRRPRRRFKLRWPANESPFWKWWSLAMTSQAGTAMPTLDYPHPAETWNQENLINKKYYRDTRYMTLDKSMDYLWQDHVHMATGNVRLPDGKGNTTLKSVSM